MPKISVIIPVYNVEKYLRECLDSVINQTLKDIEIICINDGSTDGSLAILEEYAQKDRRIKVIDQKNEGAGPARNVGMKISTGDYLIFFDADDCMKSDALEVLYANATETNSDISLCRAVKFSDNIYETIDIPWSIKGGLIDNKTSFHPAEVSKYIFQFCVGWPWDKLYKKDFILKHKLEFQNLRHSNDTYFVLMSLVYANLISYTQDIGVCHRQHQSSLANTRTKAPESFYYALEKMYHELNKKDLYKCYEQSFVNYCLEFSMWHINTIHDKRAKKIMLQKQKDILKLIGFRKYKKEYFYDNYLYNQVSRKQVFKYLKYLFSIENEKHGSIKHKVITILGIKIKFKVRSK